MSDTEETEYLSKNSPISNIHKEGDLLLKKKEKEREIPIKSIEVISDLLNNICEENKNKREVLNMKIQPFTTVNIPSMPIKDYLLRLSQFTRVNESTIILILIYIDRICKMNNFRLNFNNIYKLIICSMIIAIKYNEDNFYSSEVYAKLGGITVRELNYLEFQFLILIKFSLFVEKELFDKYYDNLISINEDNKSESDDDYEEESEESNDEQNNN
jgi:hypothetical protein